MSHAAIALREENRDGSSSRIRTAGPGSNANMVSNIKDHITCTRSMENYASQDSKVGIVSFPCDFDHMYASMSEGMVSSKEKNEYKHLKEICLQHLDLIQQQSELIARQEKQIQTLRQDKERLKQRLQRMDRRGVPKANCDTDHSDSKVARSNTPTSRRHLSPNSTDAVKQSRFRSNRTFSPKERSRSPAQWRRMSQRRQSEDGGASVSSECEMHDDSSTTTVSQRSALRGARNVGLSRKRQRGKRSISCGSREVNAAEGAHRGTIASESHTVKRPKKEETDLTLAGDPTESNSVLTTNHPYYTATGSSDSGWTLSEMCIETEPDPESNGDVLETPQWRVKVYTSLYSMEGTENLDDEVFLKRHHRLEVDERRRKRWDVQRIREQRHIEKLKQREASSNALGGSKDDAAEDPVCSLWPPPEDAQFLQVSDELPVAAFGLPISKFVPSEFSLPWLEPGALNESKSMVKRRGTRGRAPNSTIRRKRVGRGGRRADGAERK